jgi:chromosome segregation ATPase
MQHPSVADAIAAAGVVVSAVLGIISIVQGVVNRRLDARNRQLEQDRRADGLRVDGIIAERAELAKENKELRIDLRQEIERLKDDVKQARETAEGWERKYSVEVLTNATLRSENDQLRSEIQVLRADIVSLNARLDNLQPMQVLKGQ